MHLLNFNYGESGDFGCTFFTFGRITTNEEKKYDFGLKNKKLSLKKVMILTNCTYYLNLSPNNLNVSNRIGFTSRN